MKFSKTLFSSILSVLLAANAGAQTVYEAYRLSDNNYYGTARSIAMGNAFTALGGDLGSIGINPAGSAVNSYSQIAITPNVSIAATASRYDGGGGSYDPSIKDSKTRFTLPNFGVMLYMNTGNKHGLKGVSFGLTGNATANYTKRVEAGGTNSSTTYLGYLAASSDGYSSSSLSNYGYSSDISWPAMVAYRSGMTATYDDSNKYYIGATEKLYSDGSIEIAGPIDQRYGFVSTGFKYDIVFNLGFNINDRFFLGVNVGMVTFDYDSQMYIKESALDTDDFAIEYTSGSTNFDWARFREKYSAEGNGVYGKIGFIWLPIGGLRVGAAIQTPTLNFVREKWQYSGETHFTDSSFDGAEASGIGEYEYRLISPYRVNAGVALTASFGVISADYEMCDYGTMRYRNWEDGTSSGWELEDKLFRKFYGTQHSIRVGTEILLPFPGLSFRAGYNLKLSPELLWYDDTGAVDATVYEDYYYDSSLSDSEFYSWTYSLYGKEHVRADTHVFSLGLGFSSNGSFFCDVACRYTLMPFEYTSLYPDYTSGSSSPVLKNRTKMWDAVVSFGWRF